MARRRYRPNVLPSRELAEVVDAFPHLRQSRLGDFDSCRLMTRFELEGYDFNTAAQARGIIFHRFAAEVLNTLRRTGETRIPVEEALTILYEVARQRGVPDRDVVTVPAEERRLLRIAAVKFASENEFRMDRLIDVERRLFTTVSYDESRPCSRCKGKARKVADCDWCGGWGRELTGATIERVITGQPDALIADPPDGAIVLDWKTTRQPPPKYEGQHVDDRGRPLDNPAGVSYLGYFQQRLYALLIMRNYAAVNTLTLREFYPLAGEARVATVRREDLEHIEREVSGIVELFDRALMGGSRSELWEPQPGKHCSYCPKPMQCPIEEDVRAREGGITSKKQAERAAGEYVVAKSVASFLHEALKAWVELYGPINVRSAKGRFQVRWRKNKTGNGRTFGVFVPEASDRGPEDPNLMAAFDEAADRRKAAA